MPCEGRGEKVTNIFKHATLRTQKTLTLIWFYKDIIGPSSVQYNASDIGDDDNHAHG